MLTLFDLLILRGGKIMINIRKRGNVYQYAFEIAKVVDKPYLT